MKHFEIQTQDFLVTGEKFSLLPHSEIEGLLQTYPFPQENLDRYYASDEYISHSDESGGFINKIYYLVKSYNLNQKAKLVDKNIPGKHVLDYGCGTGEFVDYLCKKEFDAFGFEPNHTAFQLAEKKQPGRIFNSSEFLQNQKFDVITLWHVLEHIPDLFEKIDLLKTALSPGGKMLIAVPNYESYDSRYYKSHWAALDVPRHLWHFNKKSMQKIFGNFGMIIENVYPMYFDAFYVSMLSEKYKGSSFGFLKGMTRGLISNVKAMQTGQFSSLIYEIRVEKSI